MATVVKRSVSFPPELFEAIEAETKTEGIALSTAVAEATRLWLVTRRGLRAVREWEDEHGALTPAELAAADRSLDGGSS